MNNELLTVLEYMERERGISRETVLNVIETAVLAAAKKSELANDDVRIEVDRKTYETRAIAQMKVVEKVTKPQEEVALRDALRRHPDAVVGSMVEVEVTPRNFGRIAAQTAKQAILNLLRQAEKDIVYLEYKDKIQSVISGTVRRFDRSDVILDLGRTEAVLGARERVPTEEYQVGDRIRALIMNVENRSQGTVISVSRSHPDFVIRLFESEVTEIMDRTVEIKAIAREAGFRTKIAVISNDEKVDPVGACVGLRGIRVKNIVRELSGEKIDIVRWSDDIKTFVTNALAPAKLVRLSIEEETRTVHIVVDSDQLSLAIGKKGQNARLTSKLTGWKIDIQKEEGDLAFEEKVAQAVANLAAIEGIGEENAELLVQSGFLTLEGILAAELEDLEAIEGMAPEVAGAIRSAAEKAFEQKNPVT
ncbi:MAG TPA: transcription termination factor NusA [Kiritimatiellia bacterium]|nr:transcription termination factor NusA [Kiritimatiellia bacterium]